MPIKAEQGVVIVATDGNKHSSMALNLAVSIRANDPFAKIALIYSKTVLNSITSDRSPNYSYSTWFDYLIECPVSILDLIQQTHFDQWPQFYLYELSPFQCTLYLDTNSIFYSGKRLTELMDTLQGHEFLLPVFIEKELKRKIKASGIKFRSALTDDDNSQVFNQNQGFFHYFERTTKNEQFFRYTRETVFELLKLKKNTSRETLRTLSLIEAELRVRRRSKRSVTFPIILPGIANKGKQLLNTDYYALSITNQSPEEILQTYRRLVTDYSDPRGLNLNPEPFDKTHQPIERHLLPANKVLLDIPIFSTPEKVAHTSNEIPNHVHQIWINLDGSNSLPDLYVPMVNSWFTYSSHSHHLHSHDDLIKLISSDYPQFLEFYHQVTYITEKSDICRYLLMHKFGGVYVDADMVCIKPLQPLLQSLKKPICMCLEPPDHRFWNRTLIGSAFIASTPGLDLWLELIDFMYQNYRPNSYPGLTTGPIAVDYFLHKNGYKSKIEVLNSQYMFPIDTTGASVGDSKASFCRHEWTGVDSWLAQVPAGLRQALYKGSQSTLESVVADLDKAVLNLESSVDRP